MARNLRASRFTTFAFVSVAPLAAIAATAACGGSFTGTPDDPNPNDASLGINGDGSGGGNGGDSGAGDLRTGDASADRDASIDAPSDPGHDGSPMLSDGSMESNAVARGAWNAILKAHQTVVRSLLAHAARRENEKDARR